MRWSYKTIHYQLKKEGILGSAFLDESEIELSLNQYGKAGWELVSLLETMDGLIAVFKQPLELETRSFVSSTASVESRRQSTKEVEKKSPKAEQAEPPRIRQKIPVPLAEEVAEAVLIDEFEVEGEKTEEAAAKPSMPPVDVGLIRIE